MSEMKRKTIYSPRVIYNPRTDTTAIFQWDVQWGRVVHWFFWDGSKVKTFKGKLKYPKGFVEVAWFDEGDL